MIIIHAVYNVLYINHIDPIYRYKQLAIIQEHDASDIENVSEGYHLVKIWDS